MTYQHFASWQNQRRLTSLVVGGVFLMTVFPAFAKFKPHDRKPASGYSSAGGKRGCGNNGVITGAVYTTDVFTIPRTLVS
jgi:hypothetical protein